MKRPYNTIAVCQMCLKEFPAYSWEIKRGKSKYCSYRCSGLAKHVLSPQYGANNPNWKGGVSKDNMRYKKRYAAKNPSKIRAHAIISNKIRTGSIERQPCEMCGAGKTHGHHDDYSKPLEVRWLCRRCHYDWHRKNK
jgi:ribosomal protein S27AE